MKVLKPPRDFLFEKNGEKNHQGAMAMTGFKWGGVVFSVHPDLFVKLVLKIAVFSKLEP